MKKVLNLRRETKRARGIARTLGDTREVQDEVWKLKEALKEADHLADELESARLRVEELKSEIRELKASRGLLENLSEWVRLKIGGLSSSPPTT